VAGLLLGKIESTFLLAFGYSEFISEKDQFVSGNNSSFFIECIITRVKTTTMEAEEEGQESAMMIAMNQAQDGSPGSATLKDTNSS
jgi:hypothetical protein